MKKKLGMFVVTLLAVVTLSGCSSFQRGVKSFSSEWGGGLNRTVKVVSQTGQVLHEDSGKIDVEVNDYRVKYIDTNGKLVIVYLGGSTAIVTEE